MKNKLYRVEIWNPTNRDIVLIDGFAPSEVLIWALNVDEAKVKARNYYMTFYGTEGDFKIYEAIGSHE